MIQINKQQQQGFSIIEVLISLGLTSLLFLVMLSFFSVSVLKNHSRFTVEANAIASTELEGVRAIPFSTITNRSAVSFFTELYTLGSWSVQAGTSNQLQGTPSGSTGTTSRMRIPVDGHGDYSAETTVTVSAGAPSGWGAGLIIRAQESDRLYRYYLTANALVLDKVEPAGTTTLSSTAYAVSFGTPITLGLTVTGTQFSLTANSLTIATPTDANASWDNGESGLIILNGATATFDDVTIDGTVVTDGDFESTPVGALSDSWAFLQPNSLPSGSGTITIADYNGEDTLKEVTATVSWKEDQRDRTLSLTTLISR